MGILNFIKKNFKDEKYTINLMVVITGQKCTLHCKNCANFSPYFPKEFDFYDIDKIIEDIKKITDKIKEIKKLQIQGGDCFLHKDIIKLLKSVSENDKITSCTIATNCIIIPNNEILNVLKNPKFEVRISFYSTANETNSEKLLKCLEKNNIKHYFHKYANGNGTWSYLGGINQKKADLKTTLSNYSRCGFSGCLTLENGIISRCSRATVAHFIQKFKPKKSDFVNVRSRFFILRDLKKYIRNTTRKKGVPTACFYCNGSNSRGGDQIPAGEQLSKEEILRIKNNV